MTYPDGEKVTYNYNSGGLLRSMTGKKKGTTFNYVNQLGYDKFEQRVYLYYYGARYYDAAVGMFLSTDPHTERYPGWTPYNYCADNPINVTDPNGKDWYQDGETQALIWQDNDAESIKIDGITYSNVGKTFAWTQEIMHSEGTTNTYVNIGNDDGSTTLLVPNEYGLVQFPDSGEGFARYTWNVNDSYELDGVRGQHGDNWPIRLRRLHFITRYRHLRAQIRM